MSFVLEVLRSLNVIPVPLVDTQSQLARARAIIEGNRLGVFAAIEQSRSGLTLDEISRQAKISPVGTAVLIRALTSIGYLRCRGDRYTNSRWVKRWITDPASGIPNLLQFQHYTWERLFHLGDVVTRGGPEIDVHLEKVNASSPEQQLYTAAMRELSRLIIPAFVKRARLPRQARRLLDIGGAHGEYSRALIRKHPALKATVLDLAGPIASAQRIHDEEGNPEGIELRAGNALVDDFGQGWDVILMANFVHIFDLDQNRELFRRAFQALAPGGSILIVDQIGGVGRMGDAIPNLISLNMFAVGGRCYCAAELEELLTGAGFRNIQFMKLRFATRLMQASRM
jgi:SAM-dependent methyltransferase